MTGAAAALEGRLDDVRPAVRALAATIAGDEPGRPPPVDLVAAGLDTLASVAAAMAADLRGADTFR